MLPFYESVPSKHLLASPSSPRRTIALLASTSLHQSSKPLMILMFWATKHIISRSYAEFLDCLEEGTNHSIFL